MKVNVFKRTVFAVLCISSGLLLQACGGGGDGNTGATSGSAAPQTTPATQPDGSAGQSGNERNCAPESVAAGNRTPDLSRPQCGSTADVGGNAEGFYFRRTPYEGFAIVKPGGKMMHFEITQAHPSAKVVSGSMKLDGQSWTLNATGVRLLAMGSTAMAVTGSGSYVSRQSIEGSFTWAGSAVESWGPLAYHPSNALAVNQASIAGRWASSDGTVVLSIDATGTVAGEYVHRQVNSCALSGAVLMAEPGSAKNLYDLKLNVVDNPGSGATCDRLDSYTGVAALVLNPQPDAENAPQELWMGALSAEGETDWTYFTKQ